MRLVGGVSGWWGLLLFSLGGVQAVVEWLGSFLPEAGVVLEDVVPV